MAPIAEAFVRLRPEADRFGPDLEQAIGRNVDGTGKSLGSRLTKGFGTALKVGGAAAGVGLLAAAGGISKFVSDARESAAVGRLSAAVVKSTGGAANVTAKQMGELSTAISNKTGVDDEAIQSGENLLATFTNVRNEVGKGNQIFDRATVAATNMAAALGTEPKQAALQLGKALNDPVKGIQALTRSGVSFTQQQKDQITKLVESGNTLKAQKIILGEVGKEFGGAAAAAHDPVDKLKVILGNLSETIGTALLPFIDKAATAIGGFVSQMISGEGAGGRFASIAATIGAGIGKVGQFITTTIIPALQNFAGFVQANVLPTLRQFGQFFVAEILPRLVAFAGFITGTVVPVVGRILAAALDGARSALASVRKAIEDNRPQLTQLVEGFRTVATFIVTKVLPVLGPILRMAFQAIGRQITITINVISFLVDAFRVAANVVRASISAIVSAVNGVRAIVGTIRGAFQDAASAVRDKIGDIVGWVKALPGRVVAAVGNLGNTLAAAGRQLLQGFLDGITSMFGKIKGKLGELTGNLTQWKGPPDRDKRLLVPAGRMLMEGLIAGLDDGAKGVKATLERVTTLVKERLDQATQRLNDLRAKARDAASGVADSVRSTLSLDDLAANPVGALQNVASQAQAFAAMLAQLAAKHIPASLIAAVAAAGPVSGMAAGQALANLNAGEVTQVQTATGAIDQFARQAGQVVARVEVPPALLKAQADQVAALQAAAKALSTNGQAELVVRNGDLFIRWVRAETRRQERRA